MIISCVILNYNDSATTMKLIEAIEEYSLINYLVVVDNLSTDDSLEKLEKLETQKVKVIQTEKNGGYGYGNNFGVKYATEQLHSDYVLICNPDVMFNEDVISSALSIMNGNSNVAIVSPIQLNSEGERANTVAWKIPSSWEYILGSSFFLRRFINSYRYQDGELNKSINYVDCVPGSLLFVSTRAFSLVHGYDERIFLYCEETVLGKKLKDAGFKTVLDSTKEYHHLHSVSINKSISKEIKRKKILLSSREYVIKNYLNGTRIELLIAKVVFAMVLVETRMKILFRGS